MDSPFTLQVYNKLTELREYVNQLSFPSDDVRTSFFRYVNSIIAAYHKGLWVYDFFEELYWENINLLGDNKSVTTENQLIYIYNNILNGEKGNGYFSELNRQLILDTWIVFELSITSLLYHFYDEGEIKEMLESDYNDIKKILSRVKLSIDEQKKIDKILRDNELCKKHLTHYPIPRKFSKLYGKINSKYCRNYKDDKEFLIFYGKIRNSFHFNTIYFGQEYKYLFKGSQIILIPSKSTFSSINNFDFGIDLISELVIIFKEITESLKDINFIQPLDSDILFEKLSF